MSRVDGEFPHRENETYRNQQEPFEQRREAWASIASGIRQLFAATAADLTRLMPRLVPSGRTVLFLVKAGAVGAVLTFMLAAATMLWALQGPKVEGLAAISGPSLLVEAADGEPLGRVGSLGDALRRQDFPDILVNAVLSIEDRRFYSHRGVDMRGIARAMYANWTAGNIVEGGSTITQQLAKLQIVGSERSSLTRKLREACTAIWLERRLGKDEILTRGLLPYNDTNLIKRSRLFPTR